MFDGTRFLLHVVRVPLHSCVHRRVLPPRSTVCYSTVLPYVLHVCTGTCIHSLTARKTCRREDISRDISYSTGTVFCFVEKDSTVAPG